MEQNKQKMKAPIVVDAERLMEIISETVAMSVESIIDEKMKSIDKKLTLLESNINKKLTLLESNSINKPKINTKSFRDYDLTEEEVNNIKNFNPLKQKIKVIKEGNEEIAKIDGELDIPDFSGFMKKLGIE